MARWCRGYWSSQTSEIMWRIKTTKDGIWLGRWILHSATQFHPFSTLPWDDQYPLHHRAIDQSLREENRADRHFYIEAFDEIAAHGAFANSCDELAKRLARIC